MSNENLTEQTLADVQAGIPARDAEISALRKENDELREQLEAVGAGGVNGRLMPGSVGAELVEIPSDEDLALLFGMWGWSSINGRELRFSHFKEIVTVLLSRYTRIPAPVAAQAQPETEERPCHESDGCPTELAVLQRFWREHQPPVSGADWVRGQGDSWSGWACQYPGKLPRLYGDKAIAELNHHPEEGDRLLFLTTQPQPSGNAKAIYSDDPRYRDEILALDEAWKNGICHAVGEYAAAKIAWLRRAALAQQEEPKLDKPAKVGGSRFGAGIKWSTVIAAAQRLYAYEVTPEKEAERIAGADQKMRALRNHIAAQAQQDNSKVDVGIEAAAKALAEYMDYPWESMPEHNKVAMRKDVKTIIDAARKEQA